jgi:hypothetical protein
MTKDPQQTYLEARVEGAKDLASIYNLYQTSPECFIAGVQYALDNMLNRTQGVHDMLNGSIGRVIHINAVDILTQAKEKRL